MKLIQRAKQESSGQEASILTAVGRIDPEHLDGRGRPCPKCGGEDRFSYVEKNGSLLCRNCFGDNSNPDVVGSVAWLLDLPGKEGQNQAARLILEHLGISPDTKKKKQKKAWNGIVLKKWNDTWGMAWGSNNPPISAMACKEAGLRFGKWYSQNVSAFPVYAPANRLKPFHPYDNCEVIAHNLYSMMQGTEHSKIRVGKKLERSITVNKYESSTALVGIMAPLDRLTQASNILKCEGVTDMLAANSLLPPDWCAVSNSCGSKATPPDWFIDLIKDRPVYVIHDNDQNKAGDIGAAKWIKKLKKNGAMEVHWPKLLSGGGDLRDFLKGKTTESFMAWLANFGGEITPDTVKEIDEALAGDVEVEGDDPDAEQFKQLLLDLTVDVLYEDENGDVSIYCYATKKVTTFKVGKIGRIELVQAIGSRAMQFIAPDPDPGQYAVETVRLAIAHSAADLRIHSGELDIRGVGIWPGHEEQEHEVVVCNGSHLSVWDGEELRVELSPRYHNASYMLGSGDWYNHNELADLCEQATDPKWRERVVNEVMACMRQWTWQIPVSPMLLYGLMASTLMQSMLKWRPMVMLVGKSNTGKSTLMNLVASEKTNSIFGALSWFTSDTTRAGITQSVRSHSRAICIDEWDSHPPREQDAILRSLRGATGDGGASRRGSAHQHSTEFKFRHLVWLAGVYSSISRDVDQNRFIELTLEQPSKEKWEAFQLPAEEKVKQWSKEVLAVTIVTSRAVCRMQEAVLATEPTKDIPARARKNLSVPTSAYCVAVGMLGIKEAAGALDLASEAFVGDESVDIEEYHEQLLGRILTSLVDCGSGRKMSVSEILCSRDHRATYSTELQRHGVNVESGDLLVTRAPYIEGLQPRSLRKTLMSCAGSSRGYKRFLGKKERCVVICGEFIAENFDLHIQSDEGGQQGF